MVARETAVRAYLEAIGVGGRIELGVERLLELARILSDEGVSRGILGPNEGDRMLARHVLDSCGLFPFINRGGRIVDVGSGAGLPGLPLACITDCEVVLVDSQERRVAFARSLIKRLGLTRATAEHARAEDAARGPLRESAETVVARALAPPVVALELCAPFAAVGGRLTLAVTEDLASTPAQRARIEGVSRELGGGPPEYAEPPPLPAGEASSHREGSGDETAQEALEDKARTGLSVADESRLVLVVPKVVPTADRYPRRAGVPNRRPLG